jgi:hypothetical protein
MIPPPRKRQSGGGLFSNVKVGFVGSETEIPLGEWMSFLFTLANSDNSTLLSDQFCREWLYMRRYFVTYAHSQPVSCGEV